MSANIPRYMLLASKAVPLAFPAALGCLSGASPLLAVQVSQLGAVRMAGGYFPAGNFLGL